MEKKLNLEKAMKVRVVGRPTNVDLPGVETTSSTKADAVIVFARTLAEVDAKAGPVGPPGGHRRRVERIAVPAQEVIPHWAYDSREVQARFYKRTLD